MDTQNPAAIEIPNFKLAKVGKDRDKKRSGAGWLNGGRGAGSSFSGAMGGSGAGGGAGLFGLGASASKMLLTLLVSAIASSGAWQYGKMMSAKYGADQKGAKVAANKLFADKGDGKYADTSGVIKDENSIPNSLGYVSGSTDGLTPEERAKKAAEAEAARKAAEEAQKKADAEAAKQPETPAASTPNDPNAIAQSANPKKGLSAGKFGQLGSSMGGGGGLSGGSGLSGGINRNFGGASGLAAKPSNGSMAAFHSPTKAGTASAPKALASKSKSKGFAKKQLDNAFTQSRQATSAGKGETAASSASAPFDNNPGAGSVIAGPGVGNTSGGTAGTTSSPNPTNTGGPMGDSSNGAACSSADYAPDQNGVCQKITTNKPKNDAPYQWMIQLAEGLMALTAILSIVVLILEHMWQVAMSTVVGAESAPAIAAAEHAIKTVIGVIGAVVCALGLAIMAMTGDKMIGGIVAAAGAFIGYTVFSAPELLTNSQWISMAVGTLVSSSVGALAASSASKSQLQ